MSLNKETVRIGMRVRSLIDYSQVPKGSEGIIDEEYNGGFMIAWDIVQSSFRSVTLPKDYARWILTLDPTTPLVMQKAFRDKFPLGRRPLRDGFAYDELVNLEDVKQTVEVKHELEL